MTGRPLVIFGGTFDPPQVAHVAIARAVCDDLDADLLVVPTAANPLKANAPTDAHHRLAMARLAFAPDRFPGRHVEISGIEIDRPPPSYTIDTLRELRARFGPQRPLRLLLGSDAALGFARWREPEGILALAEPAVVLRPPLDEATFLARIAATAGDDARRRWRPWIVAAPAIDVAATDVRARCAEGGSTDGLLDPAVAGYIERHGLYVAP